MTLPSQDTAPHPMRDGYTGSEVIDGGGWHWLRIRYILQSQADAAQEWLNSASSEDLSTPPAVDPSESKLDKCGWPGCACDFGTGGPHKMMLAVAAPVPAGVQGRQTTEEKP